MVTSIKQFKITDNKLDLQLQIAKLISLFAQENPAQGWYLCLRLQIGWLQSTFYWIIKYQRWY